MPVRTSPLCNDCGFHNVSSTFIKVLMILVLVLVIGGVFLVYYFPISTIPQFLLIVLGVTLVTIGIGVLTIFLLRRTSVSE